METALSRGGVSLGSLKADYALRRTGNERMRWPVAEYIALVSAGITGGSAGSPRPVDGLSDLSRRCRFRVPWACAPAARPLTAA